MGIEVSGKSLTPAELQVLKHGDVMVTMMMMVVTVTEIHEKMNVKFLTDQSISRIIT